MSDRKQDKITDQDKLKHYRTEIPNIIDDFGLSVYAYRLYSHYKRACGADGSCEQGVRYIADLCKMSVGMVTQAKKELIELGLIWIEPTKTKGGIVDSVTLPDLWEFNFPIYAVVSGEQREQAIANMRRSLSEHPNKSSSCEHLRSRSEHLRSSRELKKEHSKKEHLEKEQEKTPADVPQTPEPTKSDPISELTILEEEIKTPPQVPASPSPVEPKIQPHVALIEAYHWSLPDDVRPPGEPNIKRNTRLAAVLAKDGIKPYDVVRFVTCSYETYRTWAENRGQSSLMSFEHVHQYIKAYVTTKGLKHGLRGNQPTQANGSGGQHPGGNTGATGESGAGAADDEYSRAAIERFQQGVNDPEYQARMQALRRNGILRDRKAG